MVFQVISLLASVPSIQGLVDNHCDLDTHLNYVVMEQKIRIHVKIRKFNVMIFVGLLKPVSIQ